MKKRTQRIIVIVLAAVLLISVLVPALGTLASATITQDDINDLENQLDDIQEEKEDVEQELEEIQGDLDQAAQAIELVQSQLLLTEEQISTSQLLLDEYDAQIAEKESEIAQLEAQEADQYEEFYAQVRWLEETGPVSYLSVFFQASSFSEMLDYAMLILDIMDYSDRIITELQQTQAELDVARGELQESRDAQALVQQDLERHQAELTAQREQAQSLYNEISQTQAELTAKAQQLAADEAEMADLLEEAERKYAEQIADANENNDGVYTWPLPGYYNISSRFGSRTHPITGRPDNHLGNDVPAPAWTPILAAQSGVVTVSRYNSSYGNYCIINHGNGYSTLYAHQVTLPTVSEGDTVTKGQVIGYVGTTGSSTGNHLHYELRINGTRADSLMLYPGMTFYWGGVAIQGG